MLPLIGSLARGETKGSLAWRQLDFLKQLTLIYCIDASDPGAL